MNPKLQVCFVCGREFGSLSINIHTPKCLEKWKVENNKLPKSQRRPEPKQPQLINDIGIGVGGATAADIQKLNDAASASAKDAMLSTCDNCQRRMLPVQLVRHQKACRPGVITFKRTASAEALRPKIRPRLIIKKMPPSDIPEPLGRTTDKIQSTFKRPTGSASPPTNVRTAGQGLERYAGSSRDNTPPSTYRRTAAGSPAGGREGLERYTGSNRGNPQQSVPRQTNLELPAGGGGGLERHSGSTRGVLSTASRIAVRPSAGKPSGRPPPSVRVTAPSPVSSVLSPAVSAPASKSEPTFSRPPTRVCYICGREFGTRSIDIHEPQCLEKWRVQNDKQPVQTRRPEPQRPQTLHGDGVRLTRDEINEVAYETFKSNLSQCSRCSRRFLPDRLIVHQRSCKA